MASEKARELYADYTRLDKLADFTKWRMNAENVDSGPDPEENFHVASINDIQEARREVRSEIMEELEDDGERDTEIILQKLGGMSEKAAEIQTDIDEKVYGENGTKELRNKAVERDNAEIVEDKFQELVDLKREYADAVIEESQEYDQDTERYKVFFDEYEPDISLKETTEFIENLKDELIPLREQISQNSDKVNAGVSKFEPASEHGDFRSLCEEVREMFGISEEEMPLDTSVHGMEHGHQYVSPLLISENKPWPKACSPSFMKPVTAPTS